MFFFRSTQRSQSARSAMIESMETRRLLSASHTGGADDGPLHDRNDDHGVHVEKEHKARHGADDGTKRDANDDKGGKAKAKTSIKTAIKAAKSKSHGADDGAAHDANDDKGGKVKSGKSKSHGADDGANHDAKDDRGGHGKDDGAGHR